MHGTDPTVLWRVTRGRDTAHATVMASEGLVTIMWFINGVMDRVENYDSMPLALARADEIRGILERDGWHDAHPS